MEATENFRTLVALRAKKGEFAALNALRDDRLVQPLLSLDHNPDSSVERLLDRVEDTVRQLWTLGRVTMLDATNMAAAPGGGSRSVLERLNQRLNTPTNLLQDDSVPFIPVADAGADEALLAHISRLTSQIGRGCAVRIRIRATIPETVERLLGHLDLDPSQLDLVIDAGYVARLGPSLIDDMLHLLDRMQWYGGFRSITVLSGSVPKTLDQLHQWEQPRFEEALWQSVRADASDVRFGDYGAVHPLASSEGWPSKHISLKYTCTQHWLYLRERIPDPDADNSRARAVRLMSTQLVHSTSFSGPDYSWGDHQLAIAAGGFGRGLGDTSKPIAFATSHHLAYLGAFQAA